MVGAHAYDSTYNNYNSFFKGELSTISVFQRVLTAAEITSLASGYSAETVSLLDLTNSYEMDSAWDDGNGTQYNVGTSLANVCGATHTSILGWHGTATPTYGTSDTLYVWKNSTAPPVACKVTQQVPGRVAFMFYDTVIPPDNWNVGFLNYKTTGCPKYWLPLRKCGNCTTNYAIAVYLCGNSNSTCCFELWTLNSAGVPTTFVKSVGPATISCISGFATTPGLNNPLSCFMTLYTMANVQAQF